MPKDRPILWEEPIRWRHGDKLAIATTAGITLAHFGRILHRKVDSTNVKTAERLSQACRAFGYDIAFEDVLRPKQTRNKWFY